MKNRVARIELHELPAGNDALHLIGEIGPVLAAPEVVEDDEAALLHELLHPIELFVRHQPEARLGHIGDRRGEELGIVHREDVAVIEMRRDEGELFQDPGEVALGARIVVRPRGLAATGGPHPNRVPQP